MNEHIETADTKESAAKRKRKPSVKKIISIIAAAVLLGGVLIWVFLLRYDFYPRNLNWGMSMQEVLKRENVERIPRQLPVLVLSGDQDPVGMNGKAAQFLQETWSEAGLDIRTVLVPKGRHELLQDVCRDQVTEDILDFMEEIIEKRKG